MSRLKHRASPRLRVRPKAVSQPSEKFPVLLAGSKCFSAVVCGFQDYDETGWANGSPPRCLKELDESSCLYSDTGVKDLMATLKKPCGSGYAVCASETRAGL